MTDDLRIAVAHPDWMQLAECRGLDPELFHAEQGESTREAKAVCAGCPVKAACLAHALDNHEKVGVWGGLSGQERRRLQRQRTLAPCGTRAAYVRHVKRGEPTCDACKAANAEHHRKYTYLQVVES